MPFFAVNSTFRRDKIIEIRVIPAKDGKISGFIDTEASGIGDPWMDYAWCIWSFEYNLGTKEYTALLLERLGIEFDAEKYERYTKI